MFKFDWWHTTITSNKQANECLTLFDQTNHSVGAFDTETTGLNIGVDKPFLFQFGWADPVTLKGYTFAVDLEKRPELAHQVIKAWHKRAASLEHYAAHNIKFDLHMLHNVGEFPVNTNNLTDTLFYIRYAHDALTQANGGPPLGLKEYASRYIDTSAKYHEKLLAEEKRAIAKHYNLLLKNRLMDCGKPDPYYKAKSYTLSVVEDIFKDPLMSVKDLPKKVQTAYLDWLNLDLPLYLRNKVSGAVESDQIPYNKLNRENIYKYAHLDIVWVIEILYFLQRPLAARGNEKIIQIENELIMPLYAMESTGFNADKEYLQTAYNKLRDYTLKRRQDLYRLAGQRVKVGQHAEIKKIMHSIYNISVDATGNEQLDLLLSDLKRNKENEPAQRFIETLQELRTLEKWISVYVKRFLTSLQDSSRLYTQINQVGTVSCRVTSDFQQFPKKPIVDNEGNELFHPRRVIKVDGNGYDSILYLDYSQIELRFQALYTILVGHPDLNLCRAYMPYKCVDKFGVPFDYKNPEHIKNWDKEWYYEEDPTKHWIPTDVHGATTKAAFGIDENHPDYHDLRYVGKRVNFAKNYGAQYGKICTMFPERTPEECKRIDAAYYTAFPGVKEYHNYCYARAQEFSWTANMFGVRYYGLSGHKLINTLVQGSAAVYLKLKIIAIYKYMKEHHMKSKLQMQIHDELSWCVYKGEEEQFFEIKHIMEDWEDTYVPVVADMEITKTTWAEKYEVNSKEELYEK